MTEVENLLITYRIGHRFDMKLAAAALARDWMDQASRGFANCCHLDAVMWLHRRLTLPQKGLFARVDGEIYGTISRGLRSRLPFRQRRSKRQRILEETAMKRSGVLIAAAACPPASTAKQPALSAVAGLTCGKPSICLPSSPSDSMPQ